MFFRSISSLLSARPLGSHAEQSISGSVLARVIFYVRAFDSGYLALKKMVDILLAFLKMAEYVNRAERSAGMPLHLFEGRKEIIITRMILWVDAFILGFVGNHRQGKTLLSAEHRSRLLMALQKKDFFQV